jgi:hypothetical protein
VINDGVASEGFEPDRSIEAWREGARDPQLRRDVLACK